MTLEIREYSGRTFASPPPSSSERRSNSPERQFLPLGCPGCRQPLQLTSGLCGNRLIAAVLLQAERLGAELECQKCGMRFVLHRSQLTQGRLLRRLDLPHAATPPDPSLLH